MKKKSIIPWILCLALPIPLLVVVLFAQVLVRAATSGSADSSAVVIIMNLFSFVVGMAAVIMLLLMPLWVIRLIKTVNYNRTLTPPQTNQPQQPNSVSVQTQPSDSPNTSHPQ